MTFFILRRSSPSVPAACTRPRILCPTARGSPGCRLPHGDPLGLARRPKVPEVAGQPWGLMKCDRTSRGGCLGFSWPFCRQHHLMAGSERPEAHWSETAPLVVAVLEHLGHSYAGVILWPARVA